MQLAAFADDKGANALANKLKKTGYAAYVEPVETSRGTLWRVRVGGYATRPEADAARATLKGEGYNGIVAPAPVTRRRDAARDGFRAQRIAHERVRPCRLSPSSLLSTLFAFARGVVREVIALAAWVAGFVAAIAYAGSVAGMFAWLDMHAGGAAGARVRADPRRRADRRRRSSRECWRG